MMLVRNGIALYRNGGSSRSAAKPMALRLVSIPYTGTRFTDGKIDGRTRTEWQG